MKNTDHVLIIGTGFAGIGMGIALKRAGIDDFTILEKADGVGGTWRANHYPGAACDVQSHLYSFSFEPNPDWSRMFAPQSEILAYLEHCTDKYGIRSHIRFKTGVVRATFDEKAGLWTVETDDGKTLHARVVVSGCGGLSRPATPDIAGIEHFRGKTFHSARWDHSFDLAGKTVAVVGTGASAIQIVPAIADKVKQLFVYQRTAPWIMPKPDRMMTPRERGLFRRVPALQQALRLGLYWSREAMGMGFVAEPRILEFGSKLALKFLKKSVRDRELRKKLTPDYKMGCKRILPTNDYYPALQRENVELVTDGIAEVRAHGIASSDGRERAVDAIVLATGFEAAEACAPFEVKGRGGRDLASEWRDGAEAYLGTTVSGFPNMFLIVGPNTGLGHSSMVFMIESQIAYVLSAIQTMRAREAKLVDVKSDVQAQYNARMHERLGKTVWASGCKSWYRTKSGKNTTLYPGFTFEYRMRTRRFDAASYEIVAKDSRAARAHSPTRKTNGASAHASVATAPAE